MNYKQTIEAQRGGMFLKTGSFGGMKQAAALWKTGFGDTDSCS
jgi:hypothetical protein